jgi:hypothetical protein
MLRSFLVSPFLFNSARFPSVPSFLPSYTPSPSSPSFACRPYTNAQIVTSLRSRAAIDLAVEDIYQQNLLPGYHFDFIFYDTAGEFLPLFVLFFLIVINFLNGLAGYIQQAGRAVIELITSRTCANGTKRLSLFRILFTCSLSHSFLLSAIALIGGTIDAVAEAAAVIAGPLMIPVGSAGARANYLSDTDKFPSFWRVCPSFLPCFPLSVCLLTPRPFVFALYRPLPISATRLWL